MADLYSEAFGMINPIVIASSPATRGADNVIKSSKCRPGAITMRNFGHGMGGGSYINPGADAMYKGVSAFHSHAVGTQLTDTIGSLDAYCEEVRKARKNIDCDIKLWVSVGHYNDLVKNSGWKEDWKNQAREVVNAGADAIELHFNTPGVVVAGNRQFNYYELVYSSTKMISEAVPGTPIMVKLAVENCDTLTAIRNAVLGGASSVGPTARWKAFYFDLDWRTTEPRPGAGYGGTQAEPIVAYIVADARTRGYDIPMYAGGGVFSYDQALRYIMAGADMVQLGALACAGGIAACEKLISDMSSWMDKNGYPDIKSLKGDALKLFNMSDEFAKKRQNRLGDAYRGTEVDSKKCVGCERCVNVCFYKGIGMDNGKAKKTKDCIGCGYCFQVCPTGALHVDKKAILKSAFTEAESAK